jgi:hypothetical protein
MPVSQEEKTGVVETLYDADTGIIRESGSNAPRDFYQPGADIQFVVGDSVTFVNIILPNGRIITKDIKKPSM